MLVSHRKKFIYTKTVKTAGTSVECYFEKYCMPEGDWAFMHNRTEHVSHTGIIGQRGKNARQNEWYNHMKAIDIKNKIGDKIWNDYFKFCVIRNPFDRLVSLYFHRNAADKTTGATEESTVQHFRNWFEGTLSAHNRKAYTINGKLCLDYFIRFEDLATGIEFVCERLGLPFDAEKIPQLKTAKRDKSVPISDLFTPDMRSVVEKAYEAEIREFGYGFPA